MKKTILAIAAIALCAAAAAQTTTEEFQARYERLVRNVGYSGVGVETLIDRWEEALPDDANPKLARFNYFYDKARLEIYSYEAIQRQNLGSNPDLFSVKLDDETFYPLLHGYFEKIAVFDGEIMMKTKDQYYVFNVEDYELKSYDEIDQDENVVIILSNSEFSEKYPNQESIDWKDTERSRQMHSR